MKISKLKIPAKFEDDEFLRKINVLNKKYKTKGIYIDETYGCIPSSIIGNARPANELSNVNMDRLRTYIEEGKKYGIEFDYTMNAVWSAGLEFTRYGRESIISEIENLVKIGINRVSVSSPGIAKIIKNNFKNLKITISINNCVDSVHSVKRWEKEGVDKIVLNRNINREFELLKVLKAKSKINFELLLNSMCNLHCSLHQYHNLINGHNSNKNVNSINSHYPQNQCIYNMLNNPIEIICSAWIRPEDVEIYERFGFHNFKLDGRCLISDDILYTAEAYMTRYYDGNIFNLFDFYNERQHQPFQLFLDNRVLDGFLQDLINKKQNCRLCGGVNTKCNAIASSITCDNKKAKKIYKQILENQLEGEVF